MRVKQVRGFGGQIRAVRLGLATRFRRRWVATVFSVFQVAVSPRSATWAVLDDDGTPQVALIVERPRRLVRCKLIVATLALLVLSQPATSGVVAFVLSPSAVLLIRAWVAVVVYLIVSVVFAQLQIRYRCGVPSNAFLVHGLAAASDASPWALTMLLRHVGRHLAAHPIGIEASASDDAAGVRRMYEKLGFRETARRRGKVRMLREPSVVRPRRIVSVSG